MTKSYRALLAGAALLAASTATAGSPAEPAAGSEILKPFKQQLQAALKAGMQQGPLAAMDACRIQAPAIARAASVDGVAVGRSSHRLRNPENVAPDWVAPVLAGWVEDPADLAPLAVSLEGGREGYMEPIVLQPLCVTCHGESIAPAVQEQINALYPDDRATGFRPGDLRGVFWAEYPAPPSSR